MNPARPLPPAEMEGAGSLEILFGTGSIIVFIGFLLFARRYWSRTKSPVGFLMLLGGIVAVGMEPFYDLMGLVWFPTVNSLLTVWSAFGVSIPWWVAIGYAWFLGGCSFYTYTRFETGVTAKEILGLYGIFLLADVVLEVSGLNLGVYTYYGNQPFSFLKFPMWWGVSNPTNPLAVGALLYFLKPYLTGARRFLIVFIVPAVSVTTVTFTTWPVWLALDNNAGDVVAHVSAVLSFGYVAMLLWAICEVNARISSLASHGSQYGSQ